MDCCAARKKAVAATHRQTPPSTPAGKFFPPSIDPDLILPRTRLLQQMQERRIARKKVLIIEAQAGQGKSVFAAQLMARLGTGYCWYQIGPDDGDTVFLASTLYAGLRDKIAGFRAPLFEEILSTGGSSTCDQDQLCALLLQDLSHGLADDFFLVLDDIYLLEGFPQSLAFIEGLISGSPPWMRFVLISRFSLTPLLRVKWPQGDSLTIDNDALALSRQEIAGFCNSLLHLPVSPETVQLLHHLTEGWTMGLILASRSLCEGRPSSEGALVSDLMAISKGGVHNFFLDQIFPCLPVALQDALLKFSLLETIPVGLAEKLSDIPAIRELLKELHRQNFFIRPLDAHHSEYVFHHLFLDSLRLVAKRHLGADQMTVHRVAAHWYAAQNRPVEAFRHDLAAEEFATADTLLKQVGFELQANNRIVTLHQMLNHVPEETIQKYAWLSYFSGIIAMDMDPPRALSFFEIARLRFHQDGDESGELLTLVQLVAFHAMVDGRHHLGAIHLERATELFDKKSGELPPILRAHAANVFLMAFSIIHHDMARADTYYDTGLKIARELQMKNLEAEARLWRCYRHVFAGDIRAGFSEIEGAFPLLRSPLVNSINKGGLALAFVNALANVGDHANYHYHRAKLRDMMGAELVDRSVFGAFMMMWDIDLAFARGDFALVRELLVRALATDFAGSGAHLRSQYQQYHALFLALEGREEEASAAAAESRQLRSEIGGPFFTAINAMFLGAVHARLGQPTEALQCFQQALEILEARNEWFVRSAIHAHRAWLFLEMDQPALARRDICDLLEALQTHHGVHFYSWTPELMAKILRVAVRDNIRPDFARQLAEERLDMTILQDGSALPVLHIKTLGTLEVSIGPHRVLRGDDLTPAQRQMLAILLSSPGLRRSQEEITELLWPESSEDKARKNFDALLIRLRKVLHEAGRGAIDSRSYLVLRKGILALEHCRVDALIFRDRASLALRHLRKKACWQADNAFRSAFELWKGEFLSGMTLADPAEILRQDLLTLFLESSCRWSQLLFSLGRYEKARAITEKALRHDPIHEELIRVLYRIYTQLSHPVKARKVLDDYARALRVEQFSENEIEDILESFWNKPS